MALRQTTDFVESLLKLVGLDRTVPNFSTLSRGQKTLAVNIPYRGSPGPLHLLIDSTAIKVEGEGEWHARKRPSRTDRHVVPGNRRLRTTRLAQDPPWDRRADAGDPGGRSHRKPYRRRASLPGLLSQLALEEEIGSVTSDGAYGARHWG